MQSTNVRDPRCAAISNHMVGDRLTSTIEYVDGSSEQMVFELYTPDEIASCITRSNWSVTIEASGLEPGSQLVIGSELAGETSSLVAFHGAPDRTLGILGDVGGQTISISATSESGERFGGDITIADD